MRPLVLLALLCLPQASGAEMAAPLSPTATAEVVPLSPYKPQPNRPVEDFFVVSIVSLPFTALWSLIGAAAVLSVSQGQFPPELTDASLIGAGATAVGLSLGVGLISVQWGGGKQAPPSLEATLSQKGNP
ncbi:MAG: hypothetical protein V4498_04625 [candidate division FCPU426 bacterium]